MSSIMRARSGLTGRCEGSEVIRGSFLEPKVAGPSMLGIACPDRHALSLITLVEIAPTTTRAPLPRKRVRSTAPPGHCQTRSGLTASRRRLTPSANSCTYLTLERTTVRSLQISATNDQTPDCLTERNFGRRDSGTSWPDDREAAVDRGNGVQTSACPTDRGSIPAEPEPAASFLAPVWC